MVGIQGEQGGRWNVSTFNDAFVDEIRKHPLNRVVRTPDSLGKLSARKRLPSMRLRENDENVGGYSAAEGSVRCAHIHSVYCSALG